MIPRETRRRLPLTRQCRVIPIVATQSISSLRSVLGTSEAWRALLQTLRTRIFLSLSDDASAELASKLCGQVAKIKPSWTVTESTRQQAEVSLLSGKAGGGQGLGRNQQVISGTTGGLISAQGVCPASQLPGDLPAL